MSTRAEIFLGIIAFTSLATAIVQIGVLVAAGLLARRVHKLVDRVDQDLRPIVEHLQAIGRDASHAVSLATAQVERLDRLATGVTEQVEGILGTVQSFMGGPLRNGASWMGGLRAVFNLVRDVRARHARTRADEDDGLFI